jgi:hypothetical protein
LHEITVQFDVVHIPKLPVGVHVTADLEHMHMLHVAGSYVRSAEPA